MNDERLIRWLLTAVFAASGLVLLAMVTALVWWPD